MRNLVLHRSTVWAAGPGALLALAAACGTTPATDLAEPASTTESSAAVSVAACMSVTFRTAISLTSDSDRGPQVVRDFNGDGCPDVAARTYSGSTESVRILLGQCNGHVALAGEYLNLGAITGLGVGDLNGDGAADLAVLTGYSPTPSVTVLLGQGNGAFTVGQNVPVAGNYPSSLVVADVDGDGRLDATFFSDFGVGLTVLRGQGDGTFGAPVDTAVPGLAGGVVVADFNGDGRADVTAVASSGTSTGNTIWLGQPGGTFAQVAGQFIKNGRATVSLDANGDGHRDLVIQTGSTLKVHLGKGDGTFRAGLTLPTGAGEVTATADFNGDGLPDLAGMIRSSGGRGRALLTVMIGNGDGTFGAASSFPAARTVYSASSFQLDAADMNGDGRPDAIMSATGINVLLNEGCAVTDGGAG